MPKTYILHRNRQEIKIQQEAEYFTVIVDDESLLDEVYQFPEVSQIKRVFNNVFKIKAAIDDNDKLVDDLRQAYDTRVVFHHAYKPTNDDATRYYITDVIVVNFKKKTSLAKMEAIMQQCGLQFIKQYGESGMTYLFKVTKTSGKNPVKLCNDLDAMPAVNFAKPNLVNRFGKSALPPDSLFRINGI